MKILSNHNIKKRSTGERNQAAQGLVERVQGELKATQMAIRHRFSFPHYHAHIAYEHASMIHNMKLHATLGMSPWEKLTGKRPPVERLRVFGCKAFIHQDKGQRKTRDETVIVGTYVGMDSTGNGDLIMVDGRIRITSHVKYNEAQAGPLGTTPARDQQPPTAQVTPRAAGGEAPQAQALNQQDPPAAAPAPAPDAAQAQPEPAPVPEPEAPMQAEAPAQPPAPAQAAEAQGPEENDDNPAPEAAPAEIAEAPGPPAPKRSARLATTAPPTEATTAPPAQPAPPKGKGKAAPAAAPPAQSQAQKAKGKAAAGTSTAPATTSTKRTTGKAVVYDQDTIRILLAATDEEENIDVLTSLPKNYKTAASIPSWAESMETEIDTLTQMGAYEIVTVASLPPNTKIIPTKFTFRVKTEPEHQQKSRLVARGDLEPEREDENNYAPTGTISAFRLLVSIAARNNWDVASFDIKSAFLIAETDPEARPVIQPPPNRPRVDQNGQPVAWRLLRQLYGLRSSPARFNRHLTAELVKLGFTQSRREACIFTKTINNKLFALFLHVDDVLVVTPSKEDTAQLLDEVGAVFAITTQQPARHFLNIHISYNNDGTISLDQTHAIDNILAKAGMSNAKPQHTTMDIGTLKEDNGPITEKDAARYRSILGAILYLQTTRPDIAAATSILCKYAKNPRQSHSSELDHLLRYLQGTKDVTLTLGRPDHEHLTAYADSDWGGDINTSRSRTGFVIMLYGPIAWRSGLQGSVAISTAEAELYSMTEAYQELAFINGLLQDFNMHVQTPLLINDNQSAIAMAEEARFSRNSRHIEIRYRFLHEHVRDNTLTIKYIPSADNIADILTKILPAPRTRLLRTKIMSE